MKTVTVVEMQTRLCELLAQQETEVTQVTYQGKPVVAVLTLERYQALLTQVTYQGKSVVAVLARERYQAPQANISDLSQPLRSPGKQYLRRNASFTPIATGLHLAYRCLRYVPCGPSPN